MIVVTYMEGKQLHSLVLGPCPGAGVYKDHTIGGRLALDVRAYMPNS